MRQGSTKFVQISWGQPELRCPTRPLSPTCGITASLPTGPGDEDAEPGPTSSSSSGTGGSSNSTLQPWAHVLADLATLASLLALTPAFLLGHLPPEMHAMGGFLAAALLAVERLVGAVGDRAGLLVCQDVGAVLGALVKTAGASGAAGSAQQQQQQGVGLGEGQQGLVQQWQQWLQEAQQQQEVPSIEQLLPQHSKLAAAAASAGSSGSLRSKPARGSSSSSSTSGHDGQLTEEQVLLLRVKELLSWSESQQYADLMAAARPLRRVVRPGSANSSRSIKSA